MKGSAKLNLESAVKAFSQLCDLFVSLHVRGFSSLALGLIAFIILASPVSAQTETAAALRRYGPFPVQDSYLRRLKSDLVKDAALLKENRLRCKKAAAARRLRFCDADHDGLINSREKMLGTDRFSKDTDQDGFKDRDELLRFHTNPLQPERSDDTQLCPTANFDGAGNTTAFGIPSAHIGNITRGQAAYNQSCGVCHNATGEKGTNYQFDQLQTRLGEAPMFITSLSTAKLADLVAFLNRLQTGCEQTPTPTPTLDAGAPTPLPSATPTNTPTPYSAGCSNQYFDNLGNTTQFSIPTPLVGNITRGQSYFAASCNGCHTGELTHGQGMSFTQLKVAVTGPKMGITTVTDQQYADMAAYLNRSLVPVCGTPPPVPTATRTPTGPTPTRTITPTRTRTPTVTPTPFAGGCSNQYFDSSGNTIVFNIPTPLVGNITSGGTYYTGSCNGCHTGEATHGQGMTFDQLKASVTGPKMGIMNVSDQQYANMTAYLNRTFAPICGTPTATATATRTPVGPTPTRTVTPTPTRTPTVTPTPFAGGCSNQYFDSSGNTIVFNIPSPLVGNITSGGTYYTGSCNGCHTGEATHGQGMTFDQLKASVTGPKMGIMNVTDQQYANMTAYLNRTLAPICGTPTATPTATNTPTGPTPTRTATPTPTQTATITPTPFAGGCSNQYFDTSGNTTLFSIPSPLIGNIGSGSVYFNGSCNGCHTGEATHGQGLTFTQLKAAVTGPKMGISTVSDQQYANMTAYLNRALAPVCAGTPTPTPTPLSDAARGQMIYQTTCQSCHTRPSSLRGHSASDIREAIQQVRQMQGITLTTEQIRVIAVYLGTV